MKNKIFRTFIQNNLFLKRKVEIEEFNHLCFFHEQLDSLYFQKYHSILLKYPEMSKMKFDNTSEVYRFLIKNLKERKIFILYFQIISLLAYIVSKLRLWKMINRMLNPFFLFYCAKYLFEQFEPEILPSENHLLQRFYHDLCFEEYTLPYLSEIEGGNHAINYKDFNRAYFQHVQQFVIEKMPTSNVVLGLKDIENLSFDCSSVKTTLFYNLSCLPFLESLYLFETIISNCNYLKFYKPLKFLWFYKCEFDERCLYGFEAEYIKLGVEEFDVVEISKMDKTKEFSFSYIKFKNDLLIQNMLELHTIYFRECEFHNYKITIRNCPKLKNVLRVYFCDENNRHEVKQVDLLQKGDNHPNISWL